MKSCTTEEGKTTKQARPDRLIEGLWIDKDVLGNASLIPIDKMVMAYVRYKSERKGEYWVHDKNASVEIGVPIATLKRSLRKLKDLGLMKGSKGNGKHTLVRMSPNWYAEKGMPEGANMESQNQNEPRTPEAQSATAKAKSDASKGSLHTYAEAHSGPCIPLRQVDKKNDDDEDKETESSSSSSSFSFTNNDTGDGETRFQGPRIGNGTIDVKLLQREAYLWALMVAYRTIDTEASRKVGGEWRTVPIGRSHAGASSSQDCLMLLALAQEAWPDSDPVMALRNLLQSCASNLDDVFKLQQWGSHHGNSISCAGLIRIGQNLDFARERMLVLGDPVASVCVPVSGSVPSGGSPELAEQIKKMVDIEERCMDKEWEPYWLEASARCMELKIPVELYASLAIIEIRNHGREFPIAWSVCRIDKKTAEHHMAIYGKFTVQTWQKPCCGNHFRRGYDCSARMAHAVASGQTVGFKNRTCLLCAASDLEHVPELLDIIPEWHGTAQELSAKLRSVAAMTQEDLQSIVGSATYVELWDGSVKCCPSMLLSTDPESSLGEFDYERVEREASVEREARDKAAREAREARDKAARDAKMEAEEAAAQAGIDAIMAQFYKSSSHAPACTALGVGQPASAPRDPTHFDPEEFLRVVRSPRPDMATTGPGPQVQNAVYAADITDNLSCDMI